MITEEGKEQLEEQAEEQAEEAEPVYACKCGFTTADVKEFKRHCLQMSHKDGKGAHKSVGLINPVTGAKVRPPWNEMTEEQKNDHRREWKEKNKKSGGGGSFIKLTTNPKEALEIRVVPKIFTMDYTPVLRMAQEAAQKEWSWPEMSLSDFIDTCLSILFRDRGIILQGYVIKREDENAS